MSRILAICLFLAPMLYINTQSSLTVEIVNLKSDKGVVIVALLDEQEETIKDKTSEIKDNTCTIVFKDLKDGSYAIRYFHDENSSGELDTNFIGIPKEGFGFSNDAFGKFGPKKFKEWLFEVSGDTDIRMTTSYL